MQLDTRPAPRGHATLALILGFVLGISAPLAVAGCGPFGGSSTSTCAVAVSGGSVKLQIEGPSADAVCGNLASSPKVSRYNGDLGSSLCDFQWQDNHFTLYGPHVLLVPGDAGCIMMRNPGTMGLLLTLLLKVAILLA